jgi:hypothetical protein
MCRSIHTLRGVPPATDDEFHAASLQFVRKVSGFHRPSRANQAAFDRAVEEIASVTKTLLDDLVVGASRGPANTG